MRNRRISVCALALLVAFVLPCAAQQNPWNGSWNIDRSTLKFDGATFSVVTNADSFTFIRGDKASPKVVCDGKPNLPQNGVITVCQKSGSGYELENTRNGKPISKVKIHLSADGNEITRTADITPADGSPYTITATARRISGGPGFAGDWKATSFKESQDKGVLEIHVNGDSVDFMDTDSDKPITCKLDGSPTTISETETISVKQDDPRTLKVTYTENGEVVTRNTLVLSSDGETIKETDITPAPSPGTMTVTFHKSK